MASTTSHDRTPVHFAAAELARYLAQLFPVVVEVSTTTPDAAQLRLRSGPDRPDPVQPVTGTEAGVAHATPVSLVGSLAGSAGQPAGGARLRLGTFAWFDAGPRAGDSVGDSVGVDSGTVGTGYSWPPVADPALDDAVYVETTGPAGIIAGSNPRSVLLAVYRYLEALGCRWVRPGPDGEHVPAMSYASFAGRSVRLAAAAAYRHRGICIEGATSFEHVRDMVDWAPRAGFNSYFTQFRESYAFFERWYAHRGNDQWPAEPFSVDRARELKARLAQEIVRRGLVFHDVGHGWTCAPFGLPGLGWEYDAPAVPPEVQPYLAEVNGQRALWEGVPLNTNLCYSNAQVRATIVTDVVEYARAHPEVGVLHIWLADGWNNHCECPDCAPARPADWYVRLLNELDARLTVEALPVRLVFLIYVDLLWPPETERIAHPERFILMFAPITRTYSRAFAAHEPLPEVPPYERNRLIFPRSVAGNLAFLRAWQDVFTGDSFVFDYHLWRDHYHDPGGMAVVDVLYQDIGHLAQIGLNGMMACQVQRGALPAALGAALMGRALWDPAVDAGALAQEYFDAAFGGDGAAALDYCRTLSQRFDPAYLRREKPVVDPEAAAGYSQLPEVIDHFRPVIRRNLDAADACQARSWHYLNVHADLCLLLAEALRCRAAGQAEAAQQAWDQVVRFVQGREADVHPALDVYTITRVLARLFEQPVNPPSESATSFI